MYTHTYTYINTYTFTNIANSNTKHVYTCVHDIYAQIYMSEYIHVYIFRGLRPEAGNAGSRGDLSHILSFVAHTCARLSPLQKLDLLKKRERERDVYIYIYYIEG